MRNIITKPSDIGSKGNYCCRLTSTARRLMFLLHLPRVTLATQEAEACFQQAIDLAAASRAKSLELRAVMSLSRLWQRQGKQAEARQRLAEIYGWFTEGFDTPDLQEAKSPAGGVAVSTTVRGTPYRACVSP